MQTNHGLISGEFDLSVRKRTADFGQDLTGNKAHTLGLNIGGDNLAGAGFVIKACDADFAGGGGNQQTVEHGGGRTQGQGACRPADCFGEDIAFNGEFHREGAFHGGRDSVCGARKAELRESRKVSPALVRGARARASIHPTGIQTNCNYRDSR